MGLTRRSLLQLMLGAAGGTMVTPLPWKLLDDASIWTQNWFLTPKLIRGETSKRHATCGLCGGGCGTRVRMLGDVPISVTGLDSHPLSYGGSCPLGILGPQLRFHPLRIVKPIARKTDGGFTVAGLKGVVLKIGKQIAKLKATPNAGTIAILDHRPGSAMSEMYREFLDKLGAGTLLSPPTNETALTAAFDGMVENPTTGIGYDFENTKTILSFNAPLFDSWNHPGRMAGLNSVWHTDKNLSPPQLIHAESNHSTTASMADTWLAINPGTEAVLALGLGHVLVRENLVHADAIAENVIDFEGADGYKALVLQFPPEKVSKITGLKVDDIVSTAKKFAVGTPSIAVGGGCSGSGPFNLEEAVAVLGLNLLVGSFGRKGGVLPHFSWPPLPPVVQAPVDTEQDAPQNAALTPDAGLSHQEKPETNMNHDVTPKKTVLAQSLTAVPDGSIGLLIIDSALPVTALPQRLIAQKLGKNGMTVSLGSYLAGTALQADVVLPTSQVGEWEHDVPTPSGMAQNTYAIAARLTEAPPGTKTPPELMALIAKASGIALNKNVFTNAIEKRLDGIVKAGRGRVFDADSGELTAIGDAGSAEDLKKTLVNGGCWIDDLNTEASHGKFRLVGFFKDGFKRLTAIGGGTTLEGNPDTYPLLLMPKGEQGAAAEGALPQVMTKLYRESQLRQLYLNAHINPTTGHDHRLADNCRAELKTPSGSIRVDVVHDKTVMPGVVSVAVGASPLSLGDVREGQFDSILDVTTMGKDASWRLCRASLKEVSRG